MQIVLLKTIDKVGRPGEVKNVADGYARNFLLARELAVLATAANIKKFGPPAGSIGKTEAGQSVKLTSEQLAARLRDITLTFAEKADENGTLFAGINREKLIRALAEKKIDLKPKQIDLPEPIKKLGERRVEINVTAGVKSAIRVTVKKL